MRRFILVLLLLISAAGWAAEMPRATCPECDRLIALTSKGNFYLHTIQPKITCPMSGKPYVAPETPPPIEPVPELEMQAPLDLRHSAYLSTRADRGSFVVPIPPGYVVGFSMDPEQNCLPLLHLWNPYDSAKPGMLYDFTARQWVEVPADE